MARRLSFYGLKQLAAWLRDTDAGADVLSRVETHWLERLWTTPEGEEAQNEVLERTAPERFERVVVELFPDGFVRVFAGKRVLVQILERPIVASDNEGALEEWLELQLPRPFREIYGAKARAVGIVSRETIQEVAWRLEQKALLERLKAL